MLPSIVNRFSKLSRVAVSPWRQSTAFFSNKRTSEFPNMMEKIEVGEPLSAEEMLFFHHKRRPRFKDYVKFKSPRKRASKLLHELGIEAVEKSKAAKPAVFDVEYEVGDAIECEIVEFGGVDSTTELKRVRGVLIGKKNRGLDTSIRILDQVMGLTLERFLPLHSPMVKSIKLLEKNFIYKGRRKVKRAKMYFLRDRNPNEFRVTKGKN